MPKLTEKEKILIEDFLSKHSIKKLPDHFSPVDVREPHIFRTINLNIIQNRHYAFPIPRDIDHRT